MFAIINRTEPALRSRFRAMKPKDILVIAVDQYSRSTVRNYASEIGFQMGRSYSVNIDREARVYKVTRTR